MPRINASQSTRIFQWKRQADITINLTPPIKNTVNTIFDKSSGVRIISFRLLQLNTEASAQDIAASINIDDGAFSGSCVLALNSGSYYWLYPNIGITQLAYNTESVFIPFFWNKLAEFAEGHRIVLTNTMTSDGGTAQELRAIIVWDKYVPVIGV